MRPSPLHRCVRSDESLPPDYTSVLNYAAGNAFGAQDFPDTTERTPDQNLVPSVVEAQLNATRQIELGVFFATYVRPISSSRWKYS